MGLAPHSQMFVGKIQGAKKPQTEPGHTISFQDLEGFFPKLPEAEAPLPYGGEY